MFCPTCQQDVPALAVPEEPGVVRCTFCSEELGARLEGTENREQGTADRPTTSLPLRPELDDWELEPDLRAAERMLTSLRQNAPPESVLRTHEAHAHASAWHVPATQPGAPPEPQRPKQNTSLPEKSGTLAWTCLSLGVMTLACGGVLIAWSLAADRGDLWSLGMPLAVIGQGGLVIGLLMQFDGLWQSSRKTEETLTQLDGKLHDLAHTTTLLGTTHSTPAQSFYVHMAEGASPHLLLADLKGQLDLLAQQMARRA